MAELARILDDLKTERAQGEVDRRRSLSGFADAVAGPTFDATRAKESAALRVATAERLRDAVTGALGAAARAARQRPARTPRLPDPHRRPVALTTTLHKRDQQVPLAPATAARYPPRMSSPPFSLRRVEQPKPRPKDSELVFGRTFTDHMAIVDYEDGRGWFDPRVVPYGPLALDPAAAVLPLRAGDVRRPEGLPRRRRQGALLPHRSPLPAAARRRRAAVHPAGRPRSCRAPPSPPS